MTERDEKITAEDQIPTRHTLLRRMKDWGDQQSWQDFFNTYWKLIYHVAVKSGLRDSEAQDVVQETILVVARNIQTFEVGSQHGSFKAWLLQNTRWRIADQFRKRLPESIRPPFLDGQPGDTSLTDNLPDPASLDLEEIWNADWKETVAEAALANLRARVDPGQYQMFDLHILRHWPAARVAQKLGVKIGKVYFAGYKLSRLLRKEIRRLEEKGV
jgi:RNA polymerase sigma factor (sigma-70 family)